MKIPFLILTSLLLISCEDNNPLADLTDLEFSLAGTENTRLAGFLIQGMNSVSEIPPLTYAEMGSYFSTGELPLASTLNLDVKNLSQSAGSLVRFDWILLSDQIEFAKGTVDEAKSLKDGKTTRIPFGIETDLMEIAPDKSLNELLNLGFSLSSFNSQPENLIMKIRPVVSIAGQTLKWPDYITVGKP